MLNDVAFQGKVALVTGGASGIGRAAAERFARSGAAVVIADLQKEQSEAAVGEIRDAGGKADYVVTDLTQEQDTEDMVSFCVERFGGLDCAFNCAGVTGSPAPLHETDLATWQRIVEIDMTSVFLSMRAEIRYMVEHGGGAIVNASSIAGLSPTSGLAPYTAAKHGVLGLTRSGAAEYTGSIRVNAVLPGATDTPMIRRYLDDNPTLAGTMRAQPGSGQFATPDRVAAAAVWLCSDDAEWVSGVSLAVDGGRLMH
ncbi:glucose 1-dehydrogenase [Rhodococcus sp. WS4]|nr:glucose 1-dehydrogenase [Rhodococcus sp. WS4]